MNTFLSRMSALGVQAGEEPRHGLAGPGAWRPSSFACVGQVERILREGQADAVVEGQDESSSGLLGGRRPPAQDDEQRPTSEAPVFFMSILLSRVVRGSGCLRGRTVDQMSPLRARVGLPVQKRFDEIALEDGFQERSRAAGRRPSAGTLREADPLLAGARAAHVRGLALLCWMQASIFRSAAGAWPGFPAERRRLRMSFRWSGPGEDPGDVLLSSLAWRIEPEAQPELLAGPTGAGHGSRPSGPGSRRRNGPGSRKGAPPCPEIVVEGGLGELGLAGDVVHGHGAVALAEDDALGGVEDGLPVALAPSVVPAHGEDRSFSSY